MIGADVSGGRLAIKVAATIPHTQADDMINAILDKKFELIMTPLEDKVSNGTDDITNLGVRK